MPRAAPPCCWQVAFSAWPHGRGLGPTCCWVVGFSGHRVAALSHVSPGRRSGWHVADPPLQGGPDVEFFKSSRLCREQGFCSPVLCPPPTAHMAPLLKCSSMLMPQPFPSPCWRPLAAETRTPHCTRKWCWAMPCLPSDTPRSSFLSKLPAELWILSFSITGANWALTPEK